MEEIHYSQSPMPSSLPQCYSTPEASQYYYYMNQNHNYSLSSETHTPSSQVFSSNIQEDNNNSSEEKSKNVLVRLENVKRKRKVHEATKLAEKLIEKLTKEAINYSLQCPGLASFFPLPSIIPPDSQIANKLTRFLNRSYRYVVSKLDSSIYYGRTITFIKVIRRELIIPESFSILPHQLQSALTSFNNYNRIGKEKRAKTPLKNTVEILNVDENFNDLTTLNIALQFYSNPGKDLKSNKIVLKNLICSQDCDKKLRALKTNYPFVFSTLEKNYSEIVLSDNYDENTVKLSGAFQKILKYYSDKYPAIYSQITPTDCLLFLHEETKTKLESSIIFLKYNKVLNTLVENSDISHKTLDYNQRFIEIVIIESPNNSSEQIFGILVDGLLMKEGSFLEIILAYYYSVNFFSYEIKYKCVFSIILILAGIDLDLPLKKGAKISRYLKFLNL